ncbi:MAG: alpha/beta hydrolase [Flavobacteriales bacterium]|nr:alpha/beta hydrolase [Flavobacteriales bacterium]
MKPLWNLPPKFISTTHSLGRFLRRDVVGLTPVQIRLALDSLSRLYPGPADVHFSYEMRQGMQVARLRRKRDKPNHGVFFVHGGGFAFGSARTHRAIASALTKETGCEVWIPEYPLAPECPFPAALEALDAMWTEFKSQYETVFVLADSAGGSLALAMMQRLSNEERNNIQGLMLLSPWVDLRSNSMSSRADSNSWSPFGRLDMLEYATHYLAGEDPKQIAASPLLGSFESFPPTLIETSAVEYLHPDACALKERLLAEAVEVFWREEENSLHGWQLFPDILPEAKRSITAMSQFMDEKRFEVTKHQMLG